MKLILKKNSTSKLLQIFITDSSKTDGSGLTGLVYNSAGLTAYYIRAGDASPTAITLATVTVGTYSSGGFVEVDATNMPGIYELHPPDACLTSGADQVVIMLKGATNMAPVPLEIQLRDNTEKDIKDVVDTTLVDTNELQTDWVNGGRLDAKLDLAVARIGIPAMESLAGDIAVIDYHTDDLESRLTAARAGYLDELAATNLPADVDAILADTGITLDGKINTIDTNVDSILTDTNELQTNQGNWLTATGFATVNPPSSNLNDYKANVTNLDVAVSTRNATTPPTVSEIRTEMDTNSTKLSNIKSITNFIRTKII